MSLASFREFWKSRCVSRLKQNSSSEVNPVADIALIRGSAVDLFESLTASNKANIVVLKLLSIGSSKKLGGSRKKTRTTKLHVVIVMEFVYRLGANNTLKVGWPIYKVVQFVNRLACCKMDWPVCKPASLVYGQKHMQRRGSECG